MMDTEIKSENSEILRTCKCCLSKDANKYMWHTYACDSDTEVYGQMLADCFVLPNELTHNLDDMICEICIMKLREAYSFKEQVLEANSKYFSYAGANIGEKELILQPKSETKPEEHIENKTQLKEGLADYNSVPDHTDDETEVLEECMDHYNEVNEVAIECTEDNANNISEECEDINKLIIENAVQSIDDNNEDIIKNAAEASIEDINKMIRRVEKEYTFMIYNDKDGLMKKVNEECINDKKNINTKCNKLDNNEVNIKAGNLGNINIDDTSECTEDIEIMEYVEDDNESTEIVEYIENDSDTVVNKDLSTDNGDSDASFDDIHIGNQGNASDDNSSDRDTGMARARVGVSRPQKYLQYTPRDLQHAILAVQQKTLSLDEAAKVYRVPKVTILANIRKYYVKKAELEQDEEKLTSSKKHRRLIDEIVLLLTYTNATPFKNRANRLYCAYCLESPEYEDVNVLREHTRTEHCEERLRSIDNIMRPRWANETFKVDVNNLICTVCCVILPKWMDMFKHLAEKHNADLVEAKSNVIPFVLSNDTMACVFCKNTSASFHSLDGHMNQHYSNFVCQLCGSTFISKSRFSKHISTHYRGQYPCPECGKTFNLERYMKKHYNMVHNANKATCYFCPKIFDSTRERESHLLKLHKSKHCNITCEICGKTMNWKPLYVKHMSTEHKGDNSKKDSDNNESILPLNGAKRKQNEKMYWCCVCSKRYVSVDSLIAHINMKHSELEVLVENKDDSDS